MKKKDFLPFLEHFEHSLYYFTEGTLHPLYLLANNPTEKSFTTLHLVIQNCNPFM